MSDDLISRKALRDELCKYRKQFLIGSCENIIVSAAIGFVNSAPTAFNKEKVIEELEYDKEMSAKYSTGLREQGHIEAFDEAISIVKKGGINNILL